MIRSHSLLNTKCLSLQTIYTTISSFGPLGRQLFNVSFFRPFFLSVFVFFLIYSCFTFPFCQPAVSFIFSVSTFIPHVKNTEFAQIFRAQTHSFWNVSMQVVEFLARFPYSRVEVIAIGLEAFNYTCKRTTLVFLLSNTRKTWVCGPVPLRLPFHQRGARHELLPKEDVDALFGGCKPETGANSRKLVVLA